MATGGQRQSQGDSSPDDEVMITDEHKNKIQSCRVELVGSMDPYEVLDYLLREHVLTARQFGTIRGKGLPDSSVNGALVEALVKTSEKGYRIFVEALRKTNQKYLANLVEVKKVDLKETPPATTGEEINLKDQPDLSVEHSTTRFHGINKSKAYPMHNKSKGLVCIINVKTVVGQPDRAGTDIDRDNLIHLFKGLYFEVRHVYNDTHGLHAADILEKVKTFAGLADHKESQCAILCVLSHGSDGYIYGTDNKTVSITDIRNCFNNSNCPALMDKPKLLFFQACRGGASDKGVPMDCSDDAKQPSHGDMLIGFPTHAGYVAWGNLEKGSWYISALVKVFSEHAWDTDILTMMCEVRRLLGKKISSEGSMQCSEEVVSLMKTFYFFPGIPQK